MPILAAALLIALLGGGTSFAAEGALPGDLLYPVKIKVNEPVAAALTFSAKNKAEFEAHLAEKRLKEASALAAEGKLDAETEIELENAFESSAGKVEIHLKSLESSGSTTTAAEIGARFDDILRAYIAGLGEGVSSTDALEHIFDSVNIVIKTSGRDHDDSGEDGESEDRQDDSINGRSDDRGNKKNEGNRNNEDESDDDVRGNTTSSAGFGEDDLEIEGEVEIEVELEDDASIDVLGGNSSSSDDNSSGSGDDSGDDNGNDDNSGSGSNGNDGNDD